MPRIDNGHSPASDSIRPSTWPWGTLALFLTSVTCGILQHFDKAGKIAELLGFHFERIRHPFAVAHEQPLPAIIQSVTYVFQIGRAHV